MTTLFAAVLSAVMLAPPVAQPGTGRRAPEPAGMEVMLDAGALRALPMGAPMPEWMHPLGARGMVVTGHVPQDDAGSPGAEMLLFENPANPIWRGRLLINEGRVSGAVYVDENSRAELVGHPGGRTAVSFADPMKDPPSGIDLHGGTEARDERHAPEAEASLLGPCADDIVVDVLIVYTDALWFELEQAYVAEDRARFSIGELNDIALRSDAGAYFRLVGIRRLLDPALEEQHVESSLPVGAIQCDLDHLRAQGEGPDLACQDSPADADKWDIVHDWRDELQADLVCMFRTNIGDPNDPLNRNPSGLANLGGGATTPNNAFSVVQWGSTLNQNVARQIGRNMGCGFTPNDGPPGVPDPPGPNGLFADSFGHRFEAFPNGPFGPPQTFRTVMSLDPGTSIPYFSNPQIQYLMVPTGAPVCEFDREDAECNVPQNCQAECPARDNAKTMRQTRANVSKYRCSGFPAPTVRAWGGWEAGQTPVPPGIIRTIQVACGAPHMLALKANGTVTAWGAGTGAFGTPPNYGQADVPCQLQGVRQVAAGALHSLALRLDGTVAAWGAGVLDNGISPNYGQSIVPAGLQNVAEVDGGGFFSVARRNDGTLVAWGRNESNQLAVPAGGGHKRVRIGANHGLAITAANRIVSWGNNEYAKRPPDTFIDTVIDIDAGWSHSVAVTTNGAVRCWGAGSSPGLTGIPPHWGQSIVPNGLTGVTRVAAGHYHNIALRSNGTVTVWGRNDALQSIAPTGLANVSAVAAGINTTAVILGPIPTNCIGDLNDDRVVNGNDLGALLAAWGPCGSGPNCVPGCPADINASGFVDGDDLGLLLSRWGNCPP